MYLYKIRDENDFDVIKKNSIYVTTLHGTITSLSTKTETDDMNKYSNNMSKNASLNQIVATDKIENAIEVKYANGNVVFIDNPDENKITDVTNTIEGEEDAKSVIAILDNVLQIEDIEVHNSFDSRWSLESTSAPALVKTVAMVHSPGIDETLENYDFYPVKNYENKTTCTEDSDSNRSLQSLNLGDDIEVQNCYNINEIEQSETISSSSSLERSFEGEHSIEEENFTVLKVEIAVHENNDNLVENEIIETPKASELIDIAEAISPNVSVETLETNDENIEGPYRKPSINSNKSHEEDPMHSKSFKEKLSQLLAVQPLIVKPQKQVDNSTSVRFADKSDEIVDEESAIPTLKASKSEPDLSQLFDLSSLKNEQETSNDSNTQNNVENHIPLPPKFDPILYKTISSRHYKGRERPTLDAVVQPKSEEPIEIEQPPKPKAESSPIPFKKKLEALLKRGPSYRNSSIPPMVRISRTPQLPAESNKNATSEDNNSKNDDFVNNNSLTPDKSHEKQFANVLKSIVDRKNDKVQNNLPPKERPTTIEEARRSLKPITTL